MVPIFWSVEDGPASDSTGSVVGNSCTRISSDLPEWYVDTKPVIGLDPSSVCRSMKPTGPSYGGPGTGNPCSLFTDVSVYNYIIHKNIGIKFLLHIY